MSDALYPKVEWHGLVQVWFTGSDDTTDQFKLRRGELQLKGALSESLDFFVMLDPAKSLFENKSVAGTIIRQAKKDASILQDLGLTVKLPHDLKVTFGQFERPIGLEGLQISSSQLELMERAIISRELADKRDIGVRAEGNVAPLKLQYVVGFLNGEGPNTGDTNDQKDVAGMLILKPVEDLRLFVSAYEGTQGIQNGAQRREGIGSEFRHGPFTLRGEYLRAKDVNAKKDGWYVLGAYRLRDLGIETLNPVRVAARYEEWDANRSDVLEIHMVTVGAQYLLDEKENNKLSLDYFYSDGKGSEEDDQGIFFGFQGKF
ncbi:MAG: hypothetical protein HYW85_03830 [Deltaproteobacteria bacterium]|nr:hypothetical protein [Deltaproteobacteria bacterium]